MKNFISKKSQNISRCFSCNCYYYCLLKNISIFRVLKIHRMIENRCFAKASTTERQHKTEINYTARTALPKWRAFVDYSQPGIFPFDAFHGRSRLIPSLLVYGTGAHATSVSRKPCSTRGNDNQSVSWLSIPELLSRKIRNRSIETSTSL